MKPTEINIQEVFNKVIEKGYYSGDNEFMCHALVGAVVGGVISKEEFKEASNLIQEYLKEIGSWTDVRAVTLQRSLVALSDFQEVWPFHKRIAIYLDWENRPMPWKEGKDEYNKF